MDKETVFLEPNKVYHVFAHAVHNNNLFNNNENKQFFMNKWLEFSKGLFRTYAYCLLSNHFHFCIHVEKEELLLERFEELREIRLIKTKKLEGNLVPLSVEKLPQKTNRRFGGFLNSYVQSLNKYLKDRKGTLMRDRFGRLLVDNRTYLKDLICYIHHNPIHHFDVENYSDWQYSSYNFYSLSLENEVLSAPNVMSLFGGLDNFLAYHKTYKARKCYGEIEAEVEKWMKNNPT